MKKGLVIPDKWLSIIKMEKEGCDLSEIASRHGLTTGRVRQIIGQYHDRIALNLRIDGVGHLGVRLLNIMQKNARRLGFIHRFDQVITKEIARKIDWTCVKEIGPTFLSRIQKWLNEGTVDNENLHEPTPQARAALAAVMALDDESRQWVIEQL